MKKHEILKHRIRDKKIDNLLCSQQQYSSEYLVSSSNEEPADHVMYLQHYEYGSQLHEASKTEVVQYSSDGPPAILLDMIFAS